MCAAALTTFGFFLAILPLDSIVRIRAAHGQKHAAG